MVPCAIYIFIATHMKARLISPFFFYNYFGYFLLMLCIGIIYDFTI